MYKYLVRGINVYPASRGLSIFLHKSDLSRKIEGPNCVHACGTMYICVISICTNAVRYMYL